MAKSSDPSNLTKPLAITMGEPAGIGPELILKLWMLRKENGLAPFILIADPDYFHSLSQKLKLDVPIEISDVSDAKQKFESGLPIKPISGKVKGSHTKANKADATLICESIEKAVQLTMDGSCGGLVTAPINKKALYDAGFDFPGHTEFLAHLASEKLDTAVRPVMMLAGPELKTVPVTIHIALNQVPTILTEAMIFETGMILANDLKSKFGIANPKIAVAGLNPHAGEAGSMGMEDINIIEPAVKQLVAAGIDAIGPLPADTMFHERARKNFNAALCMYHDQALIPAKTLAFDDAVNVTLGLPFIRTSPDHGTAYDIAGKNIANPTSMLAAIKMAEAMANPQKAGT